MDNFFLKKYEKLESKNIELEKNYRLLQIERDREKERLDEVISFLKLGRPYDTGESGFLMMTYWLCGEPKQNATKMLKRLGVEVEREKGE